MNEDRLMLVRRMAIMISMVAAVILLGFTLLEPAPRRINVRWTEKATSSDRLRQATALHLDAAEPKGDRTWSYQLLDDSTANIGAIVRHPLIEDTAGIDRGNLNLVPEVPAARAVLRDLQRAWRARLPRSFMLMFVVVLAVVGLAFAWAPLRQSFRRDPATAALVMLLFCSLVLRCVLVLFGGQLYWPDEQRYVQVRASVAAAAAHDREGMARAFDEPEHVGFKVVAIVPAAIELLRGDDARIPALFFALFSVINIWLVVAIARRLDAGTTASLVAGLLFAVSASFFYYSRHLLPYDLAATFALLSIFVGTAPNAGVRQSVWCGAWAGVAFLAYAGYWTFGGAACVIHVCDAGNIRDGARRAVLAAAGLVSALGGALAIYLIAGANPIASLVTFAGEADQGTMAEGWSLPWEYLWHAEHGLLLLWVICVLACAIAWRESLRLRVVRAGIVGIVFIYVLLVTCSVVLNAFTVYGRLARQLVPFLCLIAAAVIVRAWAARPQYQRGVLALVAVLVLAIQTLVNFTPPLQQEFPREFVPKAEAAVARAGLRDPAIVYAHHIYPAPEPVAIVPGAVIEVQASHPLQYLPYQYEGFTPAQREALRSTDIRMRALVLPEGEALTAP
jgi:hypothetical protein